MASIPNVVIFGETAAGKSSLINMIAGENVSEVSSRSIGCTLQSECYTMNIGDLRFNLHDTAGLDEGQSGAVTKHNAIIQLYSLLRNKLETGVSLLVFCMRGPRIKESSVKNWRLFHEIICQRCVPIVLAVTGLENEEEGMDRWWTANEDYFMRYEMYPNAVACITATRGRRNSNGTCKFDDEYEESQTKVRRAIRTIYLRTPWRVPAAEWFRVIIETSYKKGDCGSVEEIKRSKTELGTATKELVRRCEMTAEEASALAQKLKLI